MFYDNCNRFIEVMRRQPKSHSQCAISWKKKPIPGKRIEAGQVCSCYGEELMNPHVILLLNADPDVEKALNEVASQRG